ncbi:sulfatase-like hydrolase/transferase [Bremerella sp. JC817]|uniref:sulfatase-like hydrolase/transferase n=1 Tax=Bremerella sp. JC817 TaxID=3231756 RepID=UPI003459A88C
MYWIGRSIVLVAVLVIVGAFFWSNLARSDSGTSAKATGPGEGDLQIDPTGLGSSDDDFSGDDDVHVSNMQNSLTRSLDGMLASHGEVFKDAEGGLRDQLVDADRRLSGIKSEIRSALRNANRQMRVPGQNSPLIMMVVLEGATKEDVGFYAQSGKTPLLEALAEQGTVFQSCYAGPTAEIAQHMLLSGSSFSAGRSRNNLIAEMMWNSGYRALLMDGSDWLSVQDLPYYDEQVQLALNPESGLPEKLSFNGAEAKIVTNLNDDPNDDVSAAKLLLGQARELLANTPSKRPTFIEFHFTLTAKDEKQRAAEVAEIDRLVGRLFHALDEARNGRQMMMVVVGLPAANASPVEDQLALTEDNLQVPLMIYRSHHKGVASIDAPVGLIDILPTLGDAVDSSRVPRNDGHSLLKWMDGEPIQTQRVFRWSNPSDPKHVAIRQGPWKVVMGPTTQLFYLPDDPQEQTDVAAKHPDILKTLAEHGPVESR